MDIIAGYKGIMELDLTGVRQELKKELAVQHQKDIDEYKAEQYKLEPHRRYENTIERIQKIHHKDTIHQKKRMDQQNEHQMKRVEIYNQKRDYRSL